MRSVSIGSSVSLFIGGISVLDSHPAIAYVLFGLAGIAMILGIFWSSLFRKKLKPSKQKVSDLKKVSETLTLMHQRIKQLRVELSNQDIGIEKAVRLQEKMHSTIPIPNFLMKRVHKMQQTGDDVRFIRSVELISKWFIGSEYSSGYEKNICDMGGMLETEDVGIKPVLSTDSEYRQLKEKLEMLYSSAPLSVGKPILRYERYLYGLSSVFLWNNYRVRYLV